MKVSYHKTKYIIALRLFVDGSYDAEGITSSRLPDNLLVLTLKGDFSIDENGEIIGGERHYRYMAADRTFYEDGMVHTMSSNVASELPADIQKITNEGFDFLNFAPVTSAHGAVVETQIG